MEDAAWLAAEGKTTLAAAVSKHLLRAHRGPVSGAVHARGQSCALMLLTFQSGLLEGPTWSFLASNSVKWFTYPSNTY